MRSTKLLWSHVKNDSLETHLYNEVFNGLLPVTKTWINYSRRVRENGDDIVFTERDDMIWTKLLGRTAIHFLNPINCSVIFIYLLLFGSLDTIRSFRHHVSKIPKLFLQSRVFFLFHSELDILKYILYSKMMSFNTTDEKKPAMY